MPASRREHPHGIRCDRNRSMPRCAHQPTTPAKRQPVHRYLRRKNAGSMAVRGHRRRPGLVPRRPRNPHLLDQTRWHRPSKEDRLNLRTGRRSRGQAGRCAGGGWVSKHKRPAATHAHLAGDGFNHRARTSRSSTSGPVLASTRKPTPGAPIPITSRAAAVGGTAPAGGVRPHGAAFLRSWMRLYGVVFMESMGSCTGSATSAAPCSVGSCASSAACSAGRVADHSAGRASTWPAR